MTRIATFFATVVWLGALLRLAAEAVFRLVSALVPDVSDGTVILVVVAGLTVAAVEALVLWRWTWYRRVVRQTQADVASLFGPATMEKALAASPIEPSGSFRPVLVIATAAAVVSAALPGPIAAAVALLLALGVRVAASAIVATRDIGAR